MNERDHQRDLRVVPRDVREAFRSEQINTIRNAIQDTYKALLRAAKPGAARRALAAKRDAEIAAATRQLRSEGRSDTPDCL